MPVMPPSLILVLGVVQLGIRNIRMHKLRSGLTILGIVFGVCSVISMLSIGEGASREVQDQIRQLGSQNIIVRNVVPPKDPTASSSGGSRRGPNVLDFGLRYADAERLAETLPSVEVVVPVKARTDPVRYMQRERQATVLGTVPWFPETRPLKVKPGGRFITSTDMHTYANVCVIGERFARELFLFQDPLGRTLRIGVNAYTIVGVVRDSGSGGNKDDLPSQKADVFVPLTTMKAYNGDLFFQMTEGSAQSEYVELHELVLRVKELDQVLPTSLLVEDMLARHHKKKDYELIVPLQLLEQARRTQAIFSVVLGSIAAISLLVGGIGIMNIMLASVSERTREIGIRRALGARRNDIMLQFLVECVILSVGGGLLGMALGAGIPRLVTYMSGMVTVLTPLAFFLSFGVSVFIGVVFGLYPARRAAVMDPIEALRHE